MYCLHQGLTRQRKPSTIVTYGIRRACSGGYTLIEVCTVLFLMALITGMALPAGYSFFKEEALRREIMQLQEAARTARHEAMSTQRAYTLVFQVNGWKGQSAPSMKETRATTSDKSEPADDFINHQFGTPLTCTVFSNTDDKWVGAKNFRWIFSPDGTCSPLRVRLTSNEGSWVELLFNPLTAFATEEASRFE